MSKGKMVAYGATDVSWFDIAHEECAAELHRHMRRTYGRDSNGCYRPDVVVPYNCGVPCGLCTLEDTEGFIAYRLAMVDAGYARAEDLSNFYPTCPELQARLETKS